MTNRLNLSRRSALLVGAAIGLAGCIPIDTSRSGRLSARLQIIEAAAGGTLGVALFNTADGLMIGHNRQQRFGHCSSFKMSLAALTLWRDQQGIDDADRVVQWSEEELVTYSPYTARRVQQGATLRELAQATQKTSDNTAANILLREFGGPEALTQFWRETGDEISRLDRTEPALNNVPAGELRDTTTPETMARTVAALCFDEVLSQANRSLLRQWMVDTRSGARRVRAGLPESWRAGDKTGTSIWPGMGSLYVDIGFVEPPDIAPLTFAAYYRAPETHQGIDRASEAVLAQVGQVLADFALQ